MNSKHTHALLLVLSLFVHSLLQAVSPQLSVRSQGQNNVHTILQETKMHLEPQPLAPTLVTATPLEPAPEEVAPEEMVLMETTPVETVLPEANPVIISPLESMALEVVAAKTAPAPLEKKELVPHKKMVTKTITLKRPNTPSTLITPKNTADKKSSLKAMNPLRSQQSETIRQKTLSPAPKERNRFLPQKTQSPIIQKIENTTHTNPVQKAERFVPSTPQLPNRSLPMKTQSHTLQNTLQSTQKTERFVPSPSQKCSRLIPSANSTSINKPVETAQPTIHNSPQQESASFKKRVPHKNGVLLKTAPLKTVPLKTVPFKSMSLKTVPLEPVPLKKVLQKSSLPLVKTSSSNNRVLRVQPTLPPCSRETFATYPAINDDPLAKGAPSFARYPALKDFVQPASNTPSEVYPPLGCALRKNPARKTERFVPSPSQKCSRLIPSANSTYTNKPTETAQPTIHNSRQQESASFKKLVPHKNVLLKTAPSKTVPLKSTPLKTVPLETVPLKTLLKNNTAPQEAISSPNNRVLTPRQSLPPCPTERFATYPAINDTAHTTDAPTSARYPALEDLVQPASSAPSEIYPPLGCTLQKNPTQKTKPFVQSPSQHYSPLLSRDTQETTEPIPPIHNRYQHDSVPFKKLIAHENGTLLKNVPLKATPLKSVSLSNRNAAIEVSSVQSLEKNAVISGNFALQPEIMRSFRPHALARSLFGLDLYNDTTIHIRGSAVPRNAEKDWLADYFYLSNEYEGIVCFTPRITSFLTDMSLFINLNSWFNGCFLRIQSPLTWTQWDLGMHEQIINSGNVTGAQGWRGTWTSVDNKLLSSFTDYAAWEEAGTSYVDGAGLVYPLYAAKLCPCGRTKTALADIHVDCGLYAHEGNRYRIGIFARGVMPTGTHASGEFLFEPIVGNGHYWELGAGINSYAQLWTNATHSKEVGLYIDCSLTHLFNAHQQRVFDLKGHGPLSRYILLTTSATAPASLTPAANITHAQVNISIPLQADLVALMNYTNDVFSWNVGYNFWARSCEKIDCSKITSCSLCDQCSATSGLDGVTWMPYSDSTLKNLGTEALAPALSQDDLDLNASRTKGSSHKLFTSFNYSWIELDDHVVPFVGIGAELELGNTSAASSSNTCCASVSLSQWGLWLRTGTEF